MHTQIEPEKLVIYDTDPDLKRKRDARIAIYALACLAGAFVIYYTYSDHDYAYDTIIKVGAYGLVLFALLFELLLPSPNSKLDNKISPELMVADTEGLVIATPGTTPTHHKWSEIAKVLLTKRLTHYFWGDRTSAWFVIIVYFKKRSALGVWQLAGKGMERSPEGFDVTYIDFPKQDMKSIEEAIIRLSSRKVPVASFNQITYRSGKGTEDYIP